MNEFKSIEELTKQNEKLLEVELMLTPKEFQVFAKYCMKNDIKFNDWIRKIAYEKLSDLG
ncbi:MAG: hypothetical protein ACJAWW_000410 [Sulfurimonas sp.]|jgi:hypothetical protein